jgi:hypothetical protein
LTGANLDRTTTFRLKSDLTRFFGVPILGTRDVKDLSPQKGPNRKLMDPNFSSKADSFLNLSFLFSLSRRERRKQNLKFISLTKVFRTNDPETKALQGI